MAKKKPEQEIIQPNKCVQMDDNKWAALMHLSGFGGFLIPIVGQILGPLIIWILKKDQSDFLNETGKKILDFQISCSIYFGVGLLISGLSFWLIFPIFAFVGISIIGKIVWSILVILGTIRAAKGQIYTYPLSIKFLK